MLYVDSDIQELVDQMTSATAKRKVKVWAGERRGVTIGTWLAISELNDSDLGMLKVLVGSEIAIRRGEKNEN
tara:strand:+ start:1755 stop:1970 length:216 start_codon:yes stop_codon:yes gene_type:complete